MVFSFNDTAKMTKGIVDVNNLQIKDKELKKH